MTNLVVAAAQAASVKARVETNVERHLQFVEAAAQRGAQLIVFPELSLIGYERDVAHECALSAFDGRIAPLAEAACRHKMSIIAGGPLTASPLPYLAAFLFLPDARVATYAKRNLYPGEEVFFQPGHAPSVVSIQGEHVASVICYDLSRAEYAGEAAQLGATVYAAGVFDGPTGIVKDMDRMSEYARTHRMTTVIANHGGPCMGAASGGRSAVWNDEGVIVAQAPEHGEYLVVARRDAAGVWSGDVLAM